MEKLKVKIEESTDRVSVIERFAYFILLATAFFLPIFFIPSSTFPFQFSKSVFISMAVIIAFVLWLIARLKDGRYMLPNNLVFLASGAVLAITLVSALSSSSVRTAFIGQGFEVDTWVTLAVMFVLMFLFSALFRPKERIFYLYLTLFFSFFLIVLFHALRFAFGPEFLSFGIFTNITSNLIGKWNDLGIFFALVSVLSMVTLDLLPLSKAFRTLVLLIFTFSVLSLAVVNYPTIWYVLASFSVLFYIYAFAFKKHFTDFVTTDVSGEMSNSTKAGNSKVARMGSVLSMVILVVSVIFLVDNYTSKKPIANFIADKFNVSQLEVRPNWVSTIHIAKASLRNDPFFGVGPNHFSDLWVMNKPDGINSSIFWNTDFNYGVGLLPTVIVTTGIFGLISWLFLLGSILFVGIKNLMTPVVDRLGRYLSVSSFFASLFLWTFFVFYIPSTVILAATFLFTGVFLASLYNEKLIKAKTISFIDEPKVSFISVLVLTLILIGVITLGYVFGGQYVASAYFQKALLAANVQGDIAKAERYAANALSLSSNDAYDRFMVEINLSKINTLLSQNQANVSADKVRTDFQNLLSEALKYAKAATDFDKTNYQNWVSLGRVYESVVPLNVQGAYENASSTYAEALALNPTGPQIRLMMARLELSHNDTKKANSHIQAALALKSNYTEAIFLLSQIQATEGKLKEAIASVESAAFLAPDDPTVFFQLGLLRYNNRDYKGAIEALERSIVLAPSYANAKYFLGLSYQKVGKTTNALTQFNDIKTLNPGNKEIESIITNLNAGREPFANNPPPVIQPEKRSTLPLEDESSEVVN